MARRKVTFPDKSRANESSYRLSRTFHFLAVEEIDELKRVTQLLASDPVAVVLGAGAGTATMALLESRPDISVTSIDLRESRTEKRHAKRNGFLARLTQIQACSWETASNWAKPIDLLFVDASHTYEAVKKDNQAWLPFLRDGGIAWFHDYGMEHAIWQYVKRAVDEDLQGQEQIARVCCSVAFRVKDWKV